MKLNLIFSCLMPFKLFDRPKELHGEGRKFSLRNSVKWALSPWLCVRSWDCAQKLESKMQEAQWVLFVFFPETHSGEEVAPAVSVISTHVVLQQLFSPSLDCSTLFSSCSPFVSTIWIHRKLANFISPQNITQVHSVLIRLGEEKVVVILVAC